MRPQTTPFWFLLDIALIGISGVSVGLAVQNGQALGALFGLTILWAVLMGAWARALSTATRVRLLRIIGLLGPLAYGLLCLWITFVPLEPLPSADSLPKVQLCLFIVMTLLMWLLIKAQSAKVQLSSLYRLGCWCASFGTLRISIQLLDESFLTFLERTPIRFFGGVGMLLAVDVFVMQLRKLASGWSNSSADSEPIGVLLWLLGSANNPIHSLFNTLHHQLGVDFRSSWALVVLRRALEPVLVFSLLLGWFSTALVTVEPHQKAVVERLGVPLEKPLEAGVQFVFPWPIDQVFLVDTERVFSMNIGHEEGGDVVDEPEEIEEESILWANQHADEEYTLLLGDGHDLISADGLLQYRIGDPIQYLYDEHEPEKRLRAIAYRALMHETAHRTLDEALSENLIELAQSVTLRIQKDAAAQVPSLKAVSFSFRALHPPVAVAEAYQSVVSSQIDRQTRIIRAEAYKKARIPSANAEKMAALSEAKGFAFKRKAEAAGEAFAFEGLYATVYSDLALYEFRRAQEALSEQLKGKKVVVVDHRIEQEGATLWIQE